MIGSRMLGRLCLLAIAASGLSACAFWEMSDWSDQAGVLALDRFERTETDGLGTSDVGGPWTFSGPDEGGSVGEGTARMTPQVGQTLRGVLREPSALDVDAAVSVAVPDVPDGIGVYVALHARVVDESGGSAYRFQLVVKETGEVAASLKSTDDDEPLAVREVVFDPPYVAGTTLRMRVQVEGTDPTRLRGRVWPASEAEPEAWTVEGEDVTADLQAPGGLALSAYTSSSSTRSAVVTFDELVATPLEP